MGLSGSRVYAGSLALHCVPDPEKVTRWLFVKLRGSPGNVLEKGSVLGARFFHIFNSHLNEDGESHLSKLQVTNSKIWEGQMR